MSKLGEDQGPGGFRPPGTAHPLRGAPLRTRWDMNVGEICSLSVRVCGPDQNLAEAGRVLWEADCGALPVVDSDRKVLGMITDRDISLALCTRGQRASE